MRFRKIFPEVMGPGSPLAFMGQASQPALGETISVLVWNIYKARKKGWKNDFLMLSKNRDLILLQESIFSGQHDSIFEKSSRFTWVMAGSHRYRRSRIIAGLKTGAASLPSAQEFFHSPDQEPLFKTSKLILMTKYPIKNSQKILLVVNVHAINFVSFKKYVRHINQILPLIRQHVGPVIVAGDFNCWNAARQDFLFKVMENAGLKAAVPDRKTRWRHVNRHLDHIFYSDLNLIKAETLSDIKSSDHYPIVAEFETISR